MKELTLKQLAAWCGGEIHPDGADAAVTGTQIDSRLIRKGDLFVAIPGEKVDWPRLYFQGPGGRRRRRPGQPGGG